MHPTGTPTDMFNWTSTQLLRGLGVESPKDRDLAQYVQQNSPESGSQ